MTMKVIISRHNITVYKEEKFSKRLVLARFTKPFSLEEFKIWFDVSNYNPRRISFAYTETHRKLCMITKTKFEEMNFPELEYIKKIMENTDGRL